jgi:carbon storage regulator CsrA
MNLHGLCLTRRVDETLLFITPTGEKVYIQVIGVQGKHVKLLIDAPDNVIVSRLEVQEKLEAGEYDELA